jgi:hypothetical protein
VCTIYNYRIDKHTTLEIQDRKVIFEKVADNYLLINKCWADR